MYNVRDEGEGGRGGREGGGAREEGVRGGSEGGGKERIKLSCSISTSTYHYILEKQLCSFFVVRARLICLTRVNYDDMYTP